MTEPFKAYDVDGNQLYDVDLQLGTNRSFTHLAGATASEVTEFLQATWRIDLPRHFRVFERHPDADYMCVWSGDEWLEREEEDTDND